MEESGSFMKSVFAMALVYCYMCMKVREFVAFVTCNAAPLYPQRVDIRLQEIIRIGSEVIIQHPITVRLELNELLRNTPLRPTRQRNTNVRIQIMHKIKIIPANRLGSIIRQHPVKHLQDVAPVEGPQNRRPVVVRREVGPRLHRGADLRGRLEENPPREREGQVAEDGADALELRVPDVEQPRAEGTAVFDHVLVGAHELVDLCGARVVEEDGGEVGGDFARRGEVCGEETEERAFVLLVADYEGHFCVFAGGDA